MITPQAIREKTFEKAVFGGYDMASVDSFLEELINDFTTLQKENAVLKAKMKVLVDKVEEYRGNEDALRMAILSAQKLGNMIEAEAKQKAEKMIADAKTEAAKLTREANLEVEVEQARLAESRNASAKFIDSMDMLCRRQLDFLKKIGEMDFVQQLRTEPAAAPAADRRRSCSSSPNASRPRRRSPTTCAISAPCSSIWRPPRRTSPGVSWTFSPA